MSACSGNYHTVCLDTMGGLWAFGSNRFGQCGVEEDTLRVLLPTSIPNLPQIISVACGEFHTICADSEGSVWSFGSNDYGQLGLGNSFQKREQYIPKRVEGIDSVASVACGYDFSICITNGSKCWGFGANSYGQLGLNSTHNHRSPTKLTLSNVEKVSCGGQFTFFIDSNGTVYRTGSNQHGQLLINEKKITAPEELVFSFEESVCDIQCGYSFACFLLTNGEVYNSGTLENNAKFMNELRKQELPPIKKIVCRNMHAICVDENQNLWGFGQSRLGISSFTSGPSRLQYAKNWEVVDVCTGSAHLICRDTDGDVWVYGNNDNGQLGLGHADFIPKPERLAEEFTGIFGIRRIRVKSARK